VPVDLHVERAGGQIS